MNVGKSATNATHIHLFCFLIALHLHHLYYSLVFQEHCNNVSRETLLHSSPTPFALQYGVISLQILPFSAYKTTSIYKKEYRFCYITLNLYLCIKHLTRYEQRT